MKTPIPAFQNALLRKKGEFIVKDQIIFQYPKPITSRQVKAQASYLLGKRAISAGIGVKELDKNKHIFLIAAKGAHLLSMESVAKGFPKFGPIPPPPQPIIPSAIYNNTLEIRQEGLKNSAVFREETLRGR